MDLVRAGASDADANRWLQAGVSGGAGTLARCLATADPRFMP